MPTRPTDESREMLAAEQASFDRERRRHRIAMHVAKIGTWTRDMQTGAVEWSTELTELFGLSPEQAPTTSQAFLELVHPDDRACFSAEVAAAAEERTDYHFEFRYLHSSGEYRWMAGRGRGFYDAKGKVIELAGVGIDITEERRAREAADDRASLLRQIGDNLPHGALYQVVVETDGSRKFVYWSAGIEQLIGVSAIEALDDPARLYQLVHADDLPRLAEAEQVSLEALTLFDETIRIQHALTEEWRWVRLRSAPRRVSDGRVVWDGTYADVTDQRNIAQALTHSLERLDLAQRAGHIGVFDWNVVTGALIWNDEQLRIFGLEPGTFQGTNEAWAERVFPADREPTHEAIRAAMERRDPEIKLSYRIVTPQGATRTIEGAARFSYETAGKPLRMVGVNVDVTERLAAENALLAADRRKTEFLAVLSHELRNPLAAISNALELSNSTPADTATSEWTNIVMRRQVTHLTHLVDDLLDVTRITSGKIELRTQRLDLADVLDSATGGLRLLFAQRNQELICSYPRSGMPLDADQTRLEQVVVNLLTNAAKYTPHGGRICVTAHVDGSAVSLSIADNGVGIAPELVGEMFELFAQGRRSIARSEGGLGLGLTISRRLVEMHGGTIAAKSEGEGRGSEFVLRLPLAEGDAPAPSAPITAAQRAAAKKNRRVLVVDDHIDTAQSLARLLRARGHVVHIVHDGDSAMDAARVFRPEVVLLDLGLPGMDGYEVAQHLRANQELAQPTIIAISGYGQEEDRRRSSEVGIDHHLVKPVSFPQLETILRV
ncbi:MAG: PAS domain-containing protein [Chthoniobacterales bacterium]